MSSIGLTPRVLPGHLAGWGLLCKLTPGKVLAREGVAISPSASRGPRQYRRAFGLRLRAFQPSSPCCADGERSYQLRARR